MKARSARLPAMFNSIMWSYDVATMDPESNKKTIIVQAINYGTLEHWRWLRRHYGKEALKKELSKVPASELKPRARALAALVFGSRHANTHRVPH